MQILYRLYQPAKDHKMNGFKSKSLNNHLNILSALIFIAIAVFSVNLAIITDPFYFVVFLIAAATASSWLFTAKNELIGLIASIIGWGISFLLTGSAICALLSISYLPYSITFSLVRKQKISRSVAVGIASTVITVISISVLLMLTYYRTSRVSLTAIVEAFPLFFSRLKSILYSSFYVSVAGSNVSLIAESNVNAYLFTIIGITPGIISAITALIGYITGWLYHKILELSNIQTPKKSVWGLRSSIVSTVFLLISLALSLLIKSAGVVSLTALNLTLILLPGIFAAGLSSAFTPIVQNGISRPRIFRPFVLIISLFNNVVLFITACTYFGAYDSIRSEFKNRRTDKKD